MALFEIVRFVLPLCQKSDFAKLREYLSFHGGIRDQYFGDMIAPSNAALPIKTNEMCWAIQWPHGSEMRTNSEFRSQLRKLTKAQDTKSLLFRFEYGQIPELTKALEAPICEFAIINLSPDAPKSNPDFKHSMHKTYADCYRMDGFVGGNWAYAVNTNDTNGDSVDEERNQWIEENERRLACYYLGWESIKAHEAASKTDIFAEEIVKLAPWFGPGSGACASERDSLQAENTVGAGSGKHRGTRMLPFRTGNQMRPNKSGEWGYNIPTAVGGAGMRRRGAVY